MSAVTATEDAAGDAPRLDTIHFNATKTCNLGCIFCYDNAVRGRTANLPVEVIERLAADASELGARRVILSGGEPMARADWQAIARLFDNAGMEVSLATNGTLITEEVAAFLAGLQRCTLSISLDGGRDTHDLLRRQKGAYDRTLHGLRLLKTAGVPFDLNATIFRRNFSEVADLTKISRDFDCDMRLSLLHPNGRGEAMEEEALSPEEIFPLREYCHGLRQQFGLKVFVNLPPLLQYLDEIIPGRGAACGWAVNFCGILANGDVSICGVASNEPDLVAGNILEDSFKEIWTNSPLFTQTRSFRIADLKGICRRCPFKEVCGGACRLSAFREQHDFLAPYSLCQRFYEDGYIPDHILDPARAA